MTHVTELSDDVLASAAGAMGDLGPHRVEHELTEVSTRDGVTLVTDVYHPANQDRSPAILMRTPYGRGNWRNEGVYWASYGYRLIVQDCRGTSSYFAEADDGADTVAWIENAPWFDDALFLHGPSYLGFTAWATASTRPASLRAMSVQVYSADRVSSWYPGGSFGLDIALPWAAAQASVADRPERHAQVDQLGEQAFSGLDTSFNHLPLDDADLALGGAVIPFYRERLRHDGDDPHWAPLNFSGLLSELDTPVLVIDGWYDYHRRYIWQDYQKLRVRSRGDSRLVIGPWFHTGLDQHTVNAETRRWFADHLTAADAGPEKGHASARLYVTPDHGWVETAAWPPADAVPTTLYLNPDHTATTSPAPDTAVHGYVYDPADPTPAVGLSSMGGPDTALPTDNRALEARPDVLSYTTAPFEGPVTLAGAAHARLSVNSSQPTADFFVRITDVHPNGASINIADGIRRLPRCPDLPGADPVLVEVDLGPVAHELSAGHALRVQVSSGAHPVYARNPGGTEPFATTTQLFAATQRIQLGGDHASHLTIDILPGRLS